MSRLLKKSFDAVKCKTLLQLSLQRIKVLRNKHLLNVKKLRVDTAKLIEKGQDENAKMQVEHVFRAEKRLVVYDLLEQYCQLIINRIESVKSQKECPSDLKEAVASIIYAASRCEDLEELKKVSKRLTSKYGTEFSLAAKDVRPDCGVNTRMIENLSALPPSAEMRLKLLKGIAAENKIHWDPERASAHVSMGAANVVDGPNHFESATQASSRGSQGVTRMQRPTSMHMSPYVDGVKGRANSISHYENRNVSPVGSSSSFGSACLYGHQSVDSLPRVQAYASDRRKDQSEAGRNLGFSSKPDDARTSLNVNPYAVAKAQGKMDYKVITDFTRKEQDNGSEEMGKGRKQDIVGSKKNGGMEGNVAVHEDNMGKRSKTSLSVDRLGVKCEVDLATAAEIAFVSAAQAAEAAKAAMDMVRIKSLERATGGKVDDINRWQHSRLSSGSLLEECHAMAGSNGKESTDQGNGGVLHSTVDEIASQPGESPSWDSLKFAVFDDSSGYLKQPDGYDKEAPLKEMDSWTAQHHLSKGLDGPPLFDLEPEEGSSSDELDMRATSGPLYFSNEAIEANPVAKNLKGTVHTTGFANIMASSHDKKQEQVSSIELPEVHDVFSMPQVDKYTSEQASGEEREEVEGKGGGSDDEEVPFYMKGRAAVYRGDLNDCDARTLSSKMDLMSCMITEDHVIEQSSLVIESSQPEERNLDFDDSDNSEDAISNQSLSTFEHPRLASQQGRRECFERLMFAASSLPSWSTRTTCRPQIGGGEMEPVDGEKTSTSPGAQGADYGKLATPSSTWESPGSPSWSSSLSSVNLSSPQESRAGYKHGDLLQQGKPKLSWSSPEVESPLQESKAKPLLLVEGGRDDIKQETNLENILASPGNAHLGMSRRSVRSTTRIRGSFSLPVAGHEDASTGQ